MKQEWGLSLRIQLLFCTAGASRNGSGACAFAPYLYEIPPKYNGEKVKFELSFYSSYAPLFGDLGRVNSRKQLSKSNTLRYSTPEKLVLSNLRIQSC